MPSLDFLKAEALTTVKGALVSHLLSLLSRLSPLSVCLSLSLFLSLSLTLSLPPSPFPPLPDRVSLLAFIIVSAQGSFPAPGSQALPALLLLVAYALHPLETQPVSVFTILVTSVHV